MMNRVLTHIRFIWLAFVVSLTIVNCTNTKQVFTLEQIKNQFDQAQYQSILPELRKLAKSGNPEAQYMLGFMYFYGKGVTTDRAKAKLCFESAAHHDHRLSKLALADLWQYEHAGSTLKDTTNMSVANEEFTPLPEDLSEMMHRFKHVKPLNHSKPYAYAIQLVASGDVEAIKYVIANHQDLQLELYQTQRNGKPWYVLILPSYQSANAAREAIRQLPEALKKWGPFIKSQKRVLAEQSRKNYA